MLRILIACMLVLSAFALGEVLAEDTVELVEFADGEAEGHESDATVMQDAIAPATPIRSEERARFIERAAVERDHDHELLRPPNA